MVIRTHYVHVIKKSTACIFYIFIIFFDVSRSSFILEDCFDYPEYIFVLGVKSTDIYTTLKSTIKLLSANIFIFKWSQESLQKITEKYQYFEFYTTLIRKIEC